MEPSEPLFIATDRRLLMAMFQTSRDLAIVFVE